MCSSACPVCVFLFVSKVFAWDTFNNSYDMDESDGRSYISAVSEIVTDANQTCVGAAKNTMGEARMVSHRSLCCRFR